MSDPREWIIMRCPSHAVAIARSSAIVPLGDLQRNPQRCLQGATIFPFVALTVSPHSLVTADACQS
jgi:hypothetical protein